MNKKHSRILFLQLNNIRIIFFKDEKLVVATTRLETMLGDTGIAVHPDDPKYKVYNFCNLHAWFSYSSP